MFYRINKDQDDESMPLLFFWRHVVNAVIFVKFKGRQIILETCRNSKCPIRCPLWCHKTLPCAIWKTRLFKACKKNSPLCCVKCRVNLHEICFEIFHDCYLFGCATKCLKMNESVFNSQHFRSNLLKFVLFFLRGFS